MKSTAALWGSGSALPIWILTLLLFFGTWTSGTAQLVNDGDTLTLDNTTNVVASDLVIGTNGTGTLLRLQNGAVLSNQLNATIGLNPGAKSNRVELLGPGDQWMVENQLTIGNEGSFNELFISGGTVTASNLFVGNNQLSVSNRLVLSGPGSTLIVSNELRIGFSGANSSQMIVSNGAKVISHRGFVNTQIGQSPFEISSNTSVCITGAGSAWICLSNLTVGNVGSGAVLRIEDGGSVSSETVIYTGSVVGHGYGQIEVVSGSLVATNANTNGWLLVNYGTNTLRGGLIRVNRLEARRSTSYSPPRIGVFEFLGGSLIVNTSYFDSLPAFKVGDGTNHALLELIGSDSHYFRRGLTISTNARLAGNGMIFGRQELGPEVSRTKNFGVIAPGQPVGFLTISNSYLNFESSGTLEFDIAGTAPTNQHDVINAASPEVTLDGSLTLSLLRSFYPSSNDTFTLMTFPSATGAFTNFTSGQRLTTTDGLGSFVVTVSATNVVASDYLSADTDNDGLSD